MTVYGAPMPAEIALTGGPWDGVHRMVSDWRTEQSIEVSAPGPDFDPPSVPAGRYVVRKVAGVPVLHRDVTLICDWLPA